MSTRTLHSETVGNLNIRVTFDPEWQEYQVRTWNSSSPSVTSSYHTDDKQDALDTANMLAKAERDHLEAQNV